VKKTLDCNGIGEIEGDAGKKAKVKKCREVTCELATTRISKRCIDRRIKVSISRCPRIVANPRAFYTRRNTCVSKWGYPTEIAQARSHDEAVPSG
jgi:hypothetical protein